MQKNKKNKEAIKQIKKSCTPPLHINEEEVNAKLKFHRRRMAWIKKDWKEMQSDPRLGDAQILEATEWILGPWQLYGQGIELFPSDTDFPAGTMPRALANYPAIKRAFSRTFGPNLFAEMGMADPFPWNTSYWSNFFFQIAPNTKDGLLRVIVQKGDAGFCFGEIGSYQQGGPMWIMDCTDESDIFHEIGHAVMDDGIMKFRPPLYFKYGTGKIIDGKAETIDSSVWLKTYFGKKNLDTGKDIDGVPIGFVTDYATTNMQEDFADTFKYYVYFPTTLYEKIQRQEDMGSSTLGIKAGLISALYCGLWFKDGGVPGGWPGYSL